MIKASCFLPCTPQMIGKEMAPVARAEVLGQISFGASPVGLGRLEARQHDIRVCCPVPVVGKWEPCPRHFQIRLFVQFCSTTLLLAGVAMLDSSVRTKKKKRIFVASMHRLLRLNHFAVFGQRFYAVHANFSCGMIRS